MTFARHQFELSKPQSDGEPLIVHLEAYRLATGRDHPMVVNAPSLPSGCEVLWGKFLRLHRNRGSTGWGAARITDVDIHASQQVRGMVLSPWEIDVVNGADDIWLSDFAPKPKADK